MRARHVLPVRKDVVAATSPETVARGLNGLPSLGTVGEADAEAGLHIPYGAPICKLKVGVGVM